MSKEFQIPAGEIVVNVYNVDDGVGVFRDGQQMLHVNFMDTKSASFRLSSGQSADLRMEIYNLTGGPYSARISINAANQRVYDVSPAGFHLFPCNIAWEDNLTLVAK